MKEPEDLGVKIGTKKEAEWKKILEVQKESELNSQINIEIAQVMQKLAQRKIAEEKEKFK